MESPKSSSSSERASSEPVLISIRKTDEYAKMTKLAAELKQGEDTDYIIESTGEKLPCHKEVLAMHLPWINQMFDNATTSQKQNVFEGYNIEILRLILDFMYKGIITFDKSKLYFLMVAAHMLNVPFLKEESAGIIIRDLTPENIISWWWRVRDAGIDAIENHCKDFSATHLVELAHTQCFLEMDIDRVKLYIEDSIDFYAKHDDALFSILEWVKHDAVRYKYLKNLLIFINLENCLKKSLLNLLNRYVEIVGQEKFNPKIYKTLSEAIMKETAEMKGGPKLCAVGELPGLDSTEVNARHIWAKIDGLCPGIHTIPFTNLKPNHSVCETAEGFIISGGVDSTLCVTYNVYTDTWTRLKDLPEPRMYHASLCIKEVLYVFGGEVAGTPSGSVQCLELADIGGQWKDYIDLPEPAFRAWKPNRKTIIAAVNDSVYLLGNDICMYRLIIGRDITWCHLSTCDPTLGSFNVYSMSHAFGKLYAIGECTFAWYNLDTDRWEKGQLPSEILSIRYDQTTSFPLVCLDKSVCFHYDCSVYKYRVDTQTWQVDDYEIQTVYSHLIVVHFPQNI